MSVRVCRYDRRRQMRTRLLAALVPIGVTRDERGRITSTHPGHVRDGEAFCRRILEETFREWGMHVTEEEFEDALFSLIEHGLKLERNYDSARAPNFAGYASSVLRLRSVDVGPRALLGRTGLRIAERSHEELDERTAANRRPWETLTEIESDPGQDGETDVGRLVGVRARSTDWADAVLGL